MTIFPFVPSGGSTQSKSESCPGLEGSQVTNNLLKRSMCKTGRLGISFAEAVHVGNSRIGVPGYQDWRRDLRAHVLKSPESCGSMQRSWIRLSSIRELMSTVSCEMPSFLNVPTASRMHHRVAATA